MQIEIDSVFRSITSYGLEISISEKVCLQGNTYNYEFFEEHLSPAALLIIDSAIDYINSPAYFDLSDLQSKITDWEITANMNLYGEELDAVLVYFSVLENSADFWMPTDLGGSGEGTATVASGNMATWKKCLVADAAGATGVFLEIGFALCTTPVTLGALVAAVGWGAGWSSFCAIFFYQ